MQDAVIDYPRANQSTDKDLEALANVLEYLLMRYLPMLEAEGMDRKARKWLDDIHNYRDIAWLSALCDNLKLAVEERQRLEGEGGLPATKEQNEQNEELLAIIRHIEKIVHAGSAN